MIILSFVFPAFAAGQKAFDLTKPFKKCWEYTAKNGAARIIASDNEQIIISNDSSSIISISPSVKLENWKSEISGHIETSAVLDGSSLFFVTGLEKADADKEGTFILNSISFKTGITKWQKKLVTSAYGISFVANKDFLFVSDGTASLSAVRKEDGSSAWQREFSKPVLFLSSVVSEKLGVLTGDGLAEVVSESGRVLKETKIKTEAVRSSLLRADYQLVGYSTGEVLKFMPEDGKSGVVWKVKTGGGISGLSEVEQGVLVTSLDNFIYMFNSENGKLKWKRRVSGRINLNPLITGDYSVVVNSADNVASVIDLQDGKVVNQVEIESDNYFSGSPLVFGDFLVFQTSRGIYFFSNAASGC